MKKRLLIPAQRWSISVMGFWSEAVSSGMVGDPDWNVCGHLGETDDPAETKTHD